MRIGKISENVLIRSVLRKIKTKREEVLGGAGIGADCAVLSYGDGMETVISTNPVSAPIDMAGCYGIHKALNNVAASGAEPVGVLISALLPESTEEEELQDMMRQAQDLCGSLNVQIMGGHTEVMPDIDMPILNVTCVGKRKMNDRQAAASYDRSIRAGQDVVISKWIGLEGSVRLAKEYKEELASRYPVAMIEEAQGFEAFLSIVPEAVIALQNGVCGMHDVSRGGIFGALWEMADGAGVGLEIDLKKLPVRQETIEICEYFDLNPYELLSGGSLLMTSDDGLGLVRELEKAGIPALVAGKVTSGNDRVILNEEERRFLEPPKMDQIYKLQSGKGTGID